MDKVREYGYNAAGMTEAKTTVIHELVEKIPQSEWDALQKSGEPFAISVTFTIQPFPRKNAS